MKKSSLLTACVMALAMAACTEDLSVAPELVNGTDQSPENAVSFSTYMGRQKVSRSGDAGSITNDNIKNYEFGVFAFYTGKGTYDDTKNYKVNAKNLAPNFMYNQRVYHNGTEWTYSPIKYWPNEVIADAGKGVDDQDNDKDNNPATTDYTYGGNVSFFAYAPYVKVSNQNGSSATPEDETYGVIALTGNAATEDPKLTYRIGTTPNKTVDLLWGTRGSTTLNVNDEGNQGVTGTWTAGGTVTDYQSALLKDYTTNVDLTKQTTTGRIDFAFKHALSKVGGSHTLADGAGDDEDGNTLTNGLMIVLDIDHNGNESGGYLEPLTPGTEPYDKDNSPNATKVTVKDIKIVSTKQVNTGDSHVTVDASSGDITAISFDDYNDWAVELKNQGVFNIATGVWDQSSFTTVAPFEVNHRITSDASVIGSGAGEDPTPSAATLSKKIAEPGSLEHSAAGFRSTLPIGVTTVPKNVYEDESNPLVFLPETYPVLEITVDYIVRTYDANLAGSFSEVGQKITKKLVFTKKTELNKQYNVLIHLGLTGVKFTATVSDWTGEAAPVTQQKDEETGEDIPVFDVTVDAESYNPMNVKEKVKKLILVDENDASSTSNKKQDIASDESDPSELTVQLYAFADLAHINDAGTEGKTEEGLDVSKVVSYESDALWATVDATGKVTITPQSDKTVVVKARKATITAKYGDETAEYTITQNGRKITDITVAIDNDAAFAGAGTSTVTWKLGTDATVDATIKETKYVDGSTETEGAASNFDSDVTKYSVVKINGSSTFATATGTDKIVKLDANDTNSQRNVNLTVTCEGTEKDIVLKQDSYTSTVEFELRKKDGTPVTEVSAAPQTLKLGDYKLFVIFDKGKTTWFEKDVTSAATLNISKYEIDPHDGDNYGDPGQDKYTTGPYKEITIPANLRNATRTIEITASYNSIPATTFEDFKITQHKAILTGLSIVALDPTSVGKASTTIRMRVDGTFKSETDEKVYTVQNLLINDANPIKVELKTSEGANLPTWLDVTENKGPNFASTYISVKTDANDPDDPQRSVKVVAKSGTITSKNQITIFQDNK